MQSLQWFGYFLATFTASLALGLFFVYLRNRLKKQFAKRFGGLAVLLVFVLFVFLNPELEKTLQIKALLWGSVAIAIFGIFDDIRNFSWKKQISFQFFLALVLVFSGYSIDYITSPFGAVLRFDTVEVGLEVLGLKVPLIGSLLVVFWTICIINAVNWADGIDGLAGGIAMIGGLSLLWISLASDVNQPAIAILALIFIGSVLGFWWLNFPEAKIELGTSGSYFVAFFLASAAIISGTKIATAMIVLAFPVIDFFWVIIERIKNGRLPVSRDFNHLHHKLLKLGWDNRLVVAGYGAVVCIALALAFLLESRIAKLSVVALEICAILVFLRIISKKSNLLVKNKNEKQLFS